MEEICHWASCKLFIPFLLKLRCNLFKTFVIIFDLFLEYCDENDIKDEL